jgi:putative transposase
MDAGKPRCIRATSGRVFEHSDGSRVGTAQLEPLIPPAKPGGRARKTDMRAAMNAIFCLLRTGCPWRTLPRDGFPPRSSVYTIVRMVQRESVWASICAERHGILREQRGQEASPSAAILDSQSVKSAEKGGARSTRRARMRPRA